MIPGDYALFDFKNNYYWVKNRPYGYNWQNETVLMAEFTDKMEEATLMTWQEVRDMIAKFESGHIVMGGRFKADIKSLGRQAILLLSEEDAKKINL